MEVIEYNAECSGKDDSTHHQNQDSCSACIKQGHKWNHYDVNIDEDFDDGSVPFLVNACNLPAVQYQKCWESDDENDGGQK